MPFLFIFNMVEQIRLLPFDFISSYLEKVHLHCDRSTLLSLVLQHPIAKEGIVLHPNDFEKFRLQSGTTEYTFRCLFKGSHRYGDGGENAEDIELLRNGKPIFVSRDYDTYMTYSDDSEDH